MADHTEDVDYDDEAEEVNAAEEKGSQSRGRGHNPSSKHSGGGDRGGIFDRLGTIETGRSGAPMQSVEGWVIFVRNVHAEAAEDDVVDKFSDFGDVKGIQLNLDRRTGFVKGYALIEYAKYDEALSAIKGMNGESILGQEVTVDWAFSK